MQAVFVDDRLDPGQFGDLMDQGIGVLSRQRMATPPAGIGLRVAGRVEPLGGDQGAERLATAGLPAALPLGRGRWRLALQADRVGGGRLGGVGGVELESRLEIADGGLQGGDPIPEGLPGVQEGDLGVGGHVVPEWLRDRKLLTHMQ
jgi:hypothetical protein